MTIRYIIVGIMWLSAGLLAIWTLRKYAPADLAPLARLLFPVLLIGGGIGGVVAVLMTLPEGKGEDLPPLRPFVLEPLSA